MNEIFSMTNTTKLVNLDGTDYIIRIPGKGTDKLVNRQEEHIIYKLISKYRLSDEVLYFDEVSGLKITRYICDCHNCNPQNIHEVTTAMNTIRHLHLMNIHVNFEFNLKQKIEFYENLMQKSLYDDYEETKKSIFLLLNAIDSMKIKKCLCHMDANPDNILIDNYTHRVKALLDWEYAAMQDPIIDIAMFAIYSGYSHNEIDRLLNIYMKDVVRDRDLKFRYYSYIAAGGLLWSNWCEYKNQLGQSFGGKYELSQYNYAKEYSEYAKELMK